MNSKIFRKWLSLRLGRLLFFGTIFRLDGKWQIINFVELGFIRFTNVFEWSFIVSLKIISIEFNTEEFFVDLVDCFYEILNIRFVLIFFIKHFIGFISRALCFEEFTIGKIIFFLFVREFAFVLGLSSISREEIIIFGG